MRQSIRLTLLLLVALAPRASAQPVVQLAPLDLPSDAGFGASVAMVGGLIAVGAPGVRAVYLIDPLTTAVVHRITNPTPGVTTAAFGASLAVVGGNLLVGDPRDNGGPGLGAAYLFNPTTGALVQSFRSPQTLVPPSACGFNFGVSVAAVGADVLVGAPDDTAGIYPEAGAAYRFDATTGALLRSYFSPNRFGVVCGNFGYGVTALGGDVVVGAPWDLYALYAIPGAAYRFDAATGTLLAQYTPTATSMTGPGIGRALATAAGLVVAGGPAFDPQAAFIFDAGGPLVRTLTGGSCTSCTDYGTFVEGAGSRVLIATTATFSEPSGGYVLVVDPTSGAIDRALRDPTPVPLGSDAFGRWAAAGDGFFAVGAPGDEGNGAGAVGTGSVFVFYGGGTGCNPCETAGPLGTCVVAPAPTCRPVTDARATLLKVTNRSVDTGDRVVWRWKGQVPSRGDFGHPGQSFEDYSLCVYDASGPTPSLLFRAVAPGACTGSPCWRNLVYANRAASPEGVKRITLTEGHPPQRPAGKVQLLGTGELLSNRPFGLPSLPLPVPLRVQLQARDGLCWEATHSSPTINTASQFVSRAD